MCYALRNYIFEAHFDNASEQEIFCPLKKIKRICTLSKNNKGPGDSARMCWLLYSVSINTLVNANHQLL